jgi:putative mRNA 3-end processing factor
MELRYSRYAAKSFNTLGYHSPFVINGVQLTFIPAGHMLGSAMVLMEYNDTSYLYTGDYKLQPDATCEPTAWVKTDVLITESTFADPNTIHPDPVSEIKKINNIQSNILLGAYGTGKSQRLIRMINDHAPQKKILVHHRIMAINKIYENAGFKLGNYQLYGRKLMKAQDEFVYIVPPFTFDSYIRATGVKRLFASGWDRLQVNREDTLFISDHVDWNDILETVKNVAPTEIWTLHGNGRHLQAYYGDSIKVKILN